MKKQFVDRTKKVLRRSLIVAGVIFFLFLGFAFTTGPFYLYNWLGQSVSEYHFTPKHIIIMGGSGYPSESAMMRSFYAAKLAKEFPGSDVYVTQPAADFVEIPKTDAYGIMTDLITRGVDSSRIYLETRGKNTREEALNVIVMRSQIVNEPCVIVTSPEHMRRSILTFRKAGFKLLGGQSTFNASGPQQLEYHDKNLGGRNIPLPEVGESIQLRYQFWNHLRYQVICYRELFALFWYKVKGWA